ncbi:hypothetical protein ACU5AX_04035 [Sphingomonas sp. XXL09]|uniref:hypothetical protein n=1 Tax=Sphingomonas sp. XXL09 TaxID=3457787 RepID=UPI00406BAB06
MTLTHWLTAAAVAVAGITPFAATPAAAQRTVVTERTVVRHDERRWHNDGPRWRHHARSRRVCETQWRHHHRARVCRIVRY